METCQGCGGAGCKQCAGQAPPKLFIPIEPMGAVRTTQKGKYKSEAYQRYAAYKEHIGLMAKSYLKFIPPGVAVVITDLTFYMPMPESGKVSRIDPLTGKRKQYPVAEGMPHIAKPDIDNLIKGLFDSLNGVAWADDAQVYAFGGVPPKKIYSDYPGIEFGIEFLK